MNDDHNRLVPPTSSPTAHLTYEEVADVELSPRAQKHVADCASCRGERQSMDQTDRVSLQTLLSEIEELSPSSDALEAAAGWSLPSSLTMYLDGSAGDLPAVSPGQVWRLSWRSSQVLAVVISQTSWWTRVAPMTTDVAFADEYTLLADPDSTSLNRATAVFMRASASVPTFTLSHYLGDIGPVQGYDAAEALHWLDVAMLDGERRPDIPTGALLKEQDWDRQEFLDSLHELMKWFEASALSVLDDRGLIAGSSTTSDSPVTDIASLLKAVKDLPSLVAATGIPPGRLLDFKSGRAKPYGSDLDSLSSYFGSEIDDGYPENKRTAALELISEPANRSLWLMAAESGDDPGPSPRSFFMELLSSTVAARTVRGKTSTPPDDASVNDWKRVLRDQIAHRHRTS